MRVKKNLLVFTIRLYQILFGRRMFVGLNNYLFAMGATSLGVHGSRFTISGELHALSRLMGKRRSFTLFDIGAYRGEYSRHVRKLNPNARIVAVEANPENNIYLERVAKEIGFTSVHAIMGNKNEGTRKIYDLSDGLGSGVLSSGHSTYLASTFRVEPITGLKSYEAPQKTIDEIMKGYKIDCIDYLKIDTEGDELAVLIGARDSLAKKRIKVVQFEVSLAHAFLGISLLDFYKLLPDFEFFRILPKDIVSLERLSQVEGNQSSFRYLPQNILAIRKDLPLSPP